ncbi:polysaccharide pyruvyl transferase family protein [Confluentibacter lentus]|uniref:polysaccharide pyruvyl transferase family protein n=1 Tax=Confluentibacter lentus TaxID=1699412 RepID=UPI000C290FA8|nr:polysaccharide pyruvyl transferase family protein [Confluentibacter lentus]
MDIIYYKSDIGNFGDDLNAWLLPKLLGNDMLNSSSDSCIIGIGSILDENSRLMESTKKYKTKYIFGTGVRSINTNLQLDDSYKTLFLRGPFSSLKINKNIDSYISDGAYSLALTDFYEKKLKDSKKKYKVSFMPYFRSMDKVDWVKICKEMSWNLISPLEKNIEFLLSEIASSELVVSEAMHGAIIADICRVHWKRVRFYSHIHETEVVSEFKWNDWLYSVNLSNNYFNLRFLNTELFPKRILKKYFNSYFVSQQEKEIVKALKSSLLDKETVMLSTDEVFFEIKKKIQIIIEDFKNNINEGVSSIL